MESTNLDLSPDPLLPVRPRFMDELVYIDADNEIIIDGSDHLGVLHGAAIHHLLPKVIPLLDGHNTVAEIESSIIGVPTAHVREAIRRLFDLGLIEDASSDDLLTQHASPETVAFCRRFLKATRWNNSGYVAAKTLEAAQVGILDSLGDNWPSALLHSVLTRTGVGRIKRLNRNLLNKQLPFAESNTNQALLVSLSMNGEDPTLLAEIDDRCRRLQIRWLRVVHDLGANYADIGPLFCDECACYRCFAEFHGRPSSTLLNGTLEMNSSAALWIGMAAAEITYLISRIGPLITGRGLRRYDLRLWKSKDLHYCSVPGCSCSLPLRRGSQVFDSAAVFESYVGLRSSDVIDPSSYQQATTLGLSLSRQSKRYDTCPQFTLNPALLTVNDGIWDALNLEVKEPLGLFATDRLATILKMTAGFRSESEIGSVRRWTASAGNLGSVELYVAANRVDGLKRGLYYYQSRNHSLASIERRGGTTDIDSLMEFTLCHLTGEAPDALVLLTGAFHRLARKYGSFAYRLMHFDAGVAIAQMLLLARGLRLWSIAVPVRMDDRIDRELGLDTFNEQPTALVSISRTVCPMREAGGGQLGQPLGNRLATGAQDYHELEISDVLRRVYHESRAIDTGVALGCPPRVMPAPIEQSNDTLRHFLPSPSTWSSKPLQQILEARTTVRR
jgi:SagB-type dehydrogenase family enzyme